MHSPARPLLLALLFLPAAGGARELDETPLPTFSCLGCLVPTPTTDLPSSREGGAKVPKAPPKESKGFDPGASFEFGTAVLAVGPDRKLISDIIGLRGVMPVAGPYFGVSFGLNLTWGLSDFSHDETFALGLNSYPFGRYVSLHAEGLIGSFFLNNLTLMAVGGVDLDVPIGGEGAVMLFFGPVYAYRRVHEVAAFVSDPAWYLSGHCVGGRLGFRFCAGSEKAKRQERPEPPATPTPADP